MGVAEQYVPSECPSNNETLICSGHGSCVNNICLCENGYQGDDCGTRKFLDADAPAYLSPYLLMGKYWITIHPRRSLLTCTILLYQVKQPFVVMLTVSHTPRQQVTSYFQLNHFQYFLF